MKTAISKVKIELSIEEIEMLATELHYIIHKIETDGKTDLKVDITKKLYSHFDKVLKENNIGDTIVSYKKTPNP